MENSLKQKNREKRHKRIRAKILGDAKTPRFCVFRSKNHIYAQLVDDTKGKTLVFAKDNEIKSPKASAKISKEGTDSENIIKTRKASVAYALGKLIAEKAQANKIEKVIFDRSGYQYHGRVKALADGAREGGLRF